MSGTAARDVPTISPRITRQLAGLVRPWRGLLVLVGLCVLASALADLVPPLVIRHVINVNLARHSAAGLLLSGLTYLAAIGAGSLFTFLYGYLAALIAQRAIAAARVRLYDHLMRLPVPYFERTPLGEMISRATSDVETVDELFTSGLVTFIGEFVGLVAVAIAMVVLSPVLSLVALIVLPPLLFASRQLQIRLRDAERRTRSSVGHLNTQLSETVGGGETIWAFGRQEAFLARFDAALGDTVAAQERSAGYSAVFRPATAVLSALMIAALLWVGAGGLLPSTGVSIGTLAAFILLFQRFFAPIVALADGWQSVQAALAGAERVFGVLALPLDECMISSLGDASPSSGQMSASPGGRSTFPARRTDHRGGIEVWGVRYGYEPELAVLEGVSLTVKPGELIAVAGRTGAGKSTLLSLVGGLDAPWEGSVRIAGRDPRTLTESERRALLGVVPQTVQLVSATLAENLTFGDATISSEAIRQALRIVGLDQLVNSLPLGLATPISGSRRGGGLVLSAGQRQLVALARALVSQPQVVLLDEATAATDAVSDAKFRAALRRTAHGQACAVLTIAHRLITAREADRVIVLESGRVVEEGTPEALLAAGGAFAAWVELQRAGWDRPPAAAGAFGSSLVLERQLPDNLAP